MNTLTKMALGLIGQLKPQSVSGDAVGAIYLPSSSTEGGLSLMNALAQRQSSREFDPQPLPLQVLSDLLWAAAGIKRAELDRRTAPSAMNAQEMEVYAALPTVIRAWFDREALAQAMGLDRQQQVLLSPTIGWPKAGATH